MGCSHSLHSDIYSLGLVLWEIISTTTPFADIQNPDLVRLAVSHNSLFTLFLFCYFFV